MVVLVAESSSMPTLPLGSITHTYLMLCCLRVNRGQRPIKGSKSVSVAWLSVTILKCEWGDTFGEVLQSASPSLQSSSHVTFVFIFKLTYTDPKATENYSGTPL